jgi:mannose-6-phosphate isomerase-like protein (cupin superfamily)
VQETGSWNLIEVQIGSYLGEDDIVRLDDIYKRA